MCLADNIRYLRTKKGFSQEYLANELGYKSFTTIQKWESGIAEPPIKVLRKLAELFNVDIDDLANKKLQYETDENINDTEDQPVYYLNEDARDVAQFLYDNPDYKVLFDASRKVKKEDIEFVKQMLDRFRE